MTSDWIAMTASFAYVFAAIGLAEMLRKRLGYPVEFTRKTIHITVGMWSFGSVLLFDQRQFAVVPPLVFVGINTLSYWRGTFRAMETGEKGQLGTVYFPASFAVLIWFLWGRPDLLVASLMPMTWGDALAAVVGQRIGHHRYRIGHSVRSLEGSVTFLTSSWVATLVPLLLLSKAPRSLTSALMLAGLTALGAAGIEAISPWGIDNLTVPAISALILVLASR
jgi:phytol kinase